MAASLDVPLARLTATGADVVAVGDSEWTTPYLCAAVAGTAGDTFAADSYSLSSTRPTAPGSGRSTRPTRSRIEAAAAVAAGDGDGSRRRPRQQRRA